MDIQSVLYKSELLVGQLSGGVSKLIFILISSLNLLESHLISGEKKKHIHIGHTTP